MHDLHAGKYFYVFCIHLTLFFAKGLRMIWLYEIVKGIFEFFFEFRQFYVSCHRQDHQVVLKVLNPFHLAA